MDGEQGSVDAGVGGGLEDEGTVIILAVTLAVVLVAITIVVVVFVCVRAADQRHVPDFTDIKYQCDSADQTLSNGNAKANGCVARNGSGKTVSTPPRPCVRPCLAGVYGAPPSTVVDCRYPNLTASNLSEVCLVNSQLHYRGLVKI